MNIESVGQEHPAVLDVLMEQNKVLYYQNQELIEVLFDVINQACLDPAGYLDSMALSAYADGIRLLERHNRVAITEQYGRRVIAELNDEDS